MYYKNYVLVAFPSISDWRPRGLRPLAPLIRSNCVRARMISNAQQRHTEYPVAQVYAYVNVMYCASEPASGSRPVELTYRCSISVVLCFRIMRSSRRLWAS